jgi:uncharacterized protein (TIGR03437 family)
MDGGGGPVGTWATLASIAATAKARKDEEVMCTVLRWAFLAVSFTCGTTVLGVPVTWTLTNATFNDGGTATGTFLFDSETGVVSNWNIVTTAGSVLTAFTYTPTNSQASSRANGGCAAPCVYFVSDATFPNGLQPPANFNENRDLDLTFASPLTDAGGKVNINLVSDECLDCDPYRLFTQGSVQAAVTPTLSVNTSALNFRSAPSSSTQSQPLQISGANGIAWQASVTTAAGGMWLSVSPEAGMTPSTVTVVVNPKGLPPDVYSGSITVQAPGATPATLVIQITLTITGGSEAPGSITTVAGNGFGSPFNGGFSGDGGPATAAELYFPAGITVDASGNLFIADNRNNRIRKVSANGVITTFAGNGVAQPQTGFGTFSGDGGPATAAGLSLPSGVAIDASGNLFIADYLDNRIRKVSTNGIITTVAGNASCCGFSGDGGPATAASLYNPTAVAVDSSGNLFIADTQNNRIRKVSTDGIITTIAGNPPKCNLSSCRGFSGDGGPATLAELNQPTDVAVDASGNIFIADSVNQRVRKVDHNGIIKTIAGTGPCQAVPCESVVGVGGPATAAYLPFPARLALDSIGNLFISDSDANQILLVAASSGIMTVFAGIGTSKCGSNGCFTGDGGPASQAELDGPAAIALDASRDLFIADSGNNRIREVLAQATIKITSIGNGASFSQSFAPGMLMSVFGIGLSIGAPQTVTTAPLPLTSANGTSVTINGISAPLLYISSTQINLQIPYEAITGPATLTVNAGGQSASTSFNIQSAAPGIFVDSQTGHMVPHESANAGSTIDFYVTGAGQVTPSEPTGGVPAAGITPIPKLPLTMTIGGMPVTPVYVAIPSWSVGVLQINFTVPSTLAAGTYPAVVTIGGVSSPVTLLTVMSPGGNSQCTSIGGHWNASESGSANFSIVAPVETDMFSDSIKGSGSVTITQTGCSFQYEPIPENGLIGTNLTSSQLASLIRTGTLDGNDVTVTGILALVDTVAATQAGLTFNNVSTNLMTASGQVTDNLMTLNETGNFNGAGTYSISGQTGSFTLAITSSSTATFNWASGERPQEDIELSSGLHPNASPSSITILVIPDQDRLSPRGNENIRELLRTAVERVIVF